MSTTTASEAKPGFRSAKGCNALVTGSSGFVGARLVEMLLERYVCIALHCIVAVAKQDSYYDTHNHLLPKTN